MIVRTARKTSPILAATRFAAWWWLVVATGAGIVGSAWLRIGWSDLQAAGLGLGLGLGLVLLGELRPVVSSSRTDPAGINLATAFCFAVLLRWGLDLTVLVVAGATIVGEFGRRKPPHRAVFNIAQYAASYAAAGAVLHLAGWHASPLDPAVLSSRQLLIVGVAAAAYHAVNVLLVGTAVGLASGQSWWRSVTEKLAWHTLTTGAVLALAPLVVIVLDVDPGFLPLLALPLFLLWWTAREALDREAAAETDPLTGLANRSLLAEVVAAHAAVAPAALCLIDLDRFKEVNDTFGHATGDALLAAVGARLRSSVRETDTVARLGGDEFVLVLEVTDGEVRDLVERIADHVQAPFEIGELRLEVELSAGVALMPEHGTDLGALLRSADAAMYAAKSDGEMVRVYHDELRRDGPVMATMLADLRRATTEGQFELHYQPQVTLPGGEVYGVEGLLRWRHPDGELLAPGAFLPAARRTATMRLVTGVVLGLALDQQVRWRRQGLEIEVAINASPHDLADASFVARARDGLESRGLPADALRVELTEDALVGDPRATLATLHALTELGVGISLDDFGTGASSLTRLQQIPFDELKLDRSLVADCTRGPGWSSAIVRAIASVTADRGVRCVAEGIETAAHWQAAVALGCDAGQGWFVAHPLPADEATAWLLQHLDRGVAAAPVTATDASGRSVVGR